MPLLDENIPAQHGIIIGGTRSLGLAIAKTMLSQGRPVSVIGRTPPKAQPYINLAENQTEDENRAANAAGQDTPQGSLYFQPTDLSEGSSLPGALDAIEKRGGPWHSLVFSQRFRGEGDPWEGEWRVNVEATRRIVEHCAYREDPWRRIRHIVVIGSNASRLDASEQPVAYHAVRAALEQMVRSWAVRLGPLGVRVNMVSPTMVRKGNQPGAWPSPLEHLVPLGYACPQEQIASVVGFLCSAASQYVTGQVIMVDGGLSLLAQTAVARAISS